MVHLIQYKKRGLSFQELPSPSTAHQLATPHNRTARVFEPVSRREIWRTARCSPQTHPLHRLGGSTSPRLRTYEIINPWKLTKSSRREFTSLQHFQLHMSVGEEPDQLLQPLEVLTAYLSLPGVPLALACWSGRSWDHGNRPPKPLDDYTGRQASMMDPYLDCRESRLTVPKGL